MVGSGDLSQREVPVHIVTQEFVMQGDLHFKGVAHVTLNNPSLDAMALYGAKIFALDEQNVAAGMQVEEMVILRQHCQFIIFNPRLSGEDYTMRTGERPTIVYTSRFAIQGNLAMGDDDRFVDAMEDLKGFYLPLLDAVIRPLFPIRTQVPTTGEMVLIYRDHVKMLQER
jgi:hypothetical protein